MRQDMSVSYQLRPRAPTYLPRKQSHRLLEGHVPRGEASVWALTSPLKQYASGLRPYCIRELRSRRRD